MFRAVTLSWLFIAAFALHACKGHGDKETVMAINEVGLSGDNPKVVKELEGFAPYVDLGQALHLADVDADGLFIDFGSPARHKYTFGNWKSGWGADIDLKERSVTHVGSTGRVYFSRMGVNKSISLRVRLRSVGAQSMMVFVNDKQLPAVKFDKASTFADYDVQVPQSLLSRGDNYVLLRFNGTTQLRGESVSVALDSVRVLTASNAQTITKEPNHRALTEERAIAGKKRSIISTPSKTTLSWYVDVDKPTKLSVGLGVSRGQATYSIRARSDQGDVKVLAQGQAKQPWQEEVISLDAMQGQVVRLELVNESTENNFYWSRPQLWRAAKVSTQWDTKKAPKHVVLLLIDTMRADKFKVVNPQSRVKTPTIDTIAQNGVTFLNAQSPENWTKPSVASVLTSLWPMTHRAKTDAAKLADQATMISEVYKQAGLTTGSFIANGYVSDKFGFNQGWDHYINYIRDAKSTKAQDVFKDAATWMETNKDKRMFVYIQTIDPHVPYDPPDTFLKMYDNNAYEGIVQPRITAQQLEQAKKNPPMITFTPRDRNRLEALYDGEVSYHDDEFGKFLARLKSAGLYDDTLFVVTADHGEEFYDHQSFGHGHSTYQELLHVPMFYSYAKALPKGLSEERTVSTVDIAPTMLDISGVKAPAAFEGKSLLPIMLGKDVPAPMVAFSDFLDDRRVIRAGRYKLVLRGAKPELFDLKNDPGETKVLNAANSPVAFSYCRGLLGQFLGTGDRAHWLEQAKGKQSALPEQNIQIDDKTRDQLRAIGYMQ